MSDANSSPRLFAVERGGEAGGTTPPVVLLHGFDGRAVLWESLQERLATPQRRVLAFDLPGHGASRDYPGFGPPKVAARAILAELDARDIASAHLVGHSMGGAIACLMSLFAADRVASMTLLAPGGFGPQIGSGMIGAVMRAEGADAIRRAMGAMGARGWLPDAEIAAAIAAGRSPEDRAAIQHIFAMLFTAQEGVDFGTQGLLPLEAIAATGVPISLLWGADDPVTPFAQGSHAPPGFAFTALPDRGHMLMLEDEGACERAILAAIEHVDGA
ncbi:alpha/beta fold hydrolase [Aurantimonas sp. A2-1-M11]|uniref:alpha/beta fold hydrolase n=1 Tax=Aurantimonas sp. A2-1-M11 TaxID=3113712 RepID=UPI002F936379